MISKALLLKIFSAASMQRWNDKLCSVELVELDKQAHKMIIAYFLGKFEENHEDFNWVDIIVGGIFELLQRIIITDWKPPIFYRIKKEKEKYKRLNEWAYNKLESVIEPLGQTFCIKFKAYFLEDDDTLSKRILSAAHFYATKWEFDIIERGNPNGYEINDIKRELQERQEKYYDLKGITQLALYDKHRKFIDLCGQLRFQSRWAHLHRTPKTSVLGHLLFVAIFSYLFSSELGGCSRRCVNNYFTGLFHDFPEVLTRDISSPVKKSVAGLIDLIREYEKEQMIKEVYDLIPSEWSSEIKMFAGMLDEFPDQESEFFSIAKINGEIKKVTSDEINSAYDKDEYNPRDGEIVKAVDELAAFIEADVAIKNGNVSPELDTSKSSLKKEYEGAYIAGINFGRIYADFG